MDQRKKAWISLHSLDRFEPFQRVAQTPGAFFFCRNNIDNMYTIILPGAE
jgi:hypothetical protein